MPVYQNPEQFYAILDEGFRRMAADPQALTDFQRRRMLVTLQTTDPETLIVFDGRVNPVQVSYGQVNGRADLALKMSTDLLHQILMEEASVKQSFLSGAVQVSGNIFRALQLADLFHQIQRVYPQVRQDLAGGL
ncbi:MAG TPA: SCP2 sterol-binding domain-containing protein [Anaerolineae bacterium]|nr:SCP2 sterol-binding domain-containing protein [Anaerolineae bacterium]HNU04375.1 SCP2 sterol-binding domain-containing protein [Anaerolineae bacterium]